MQGVRACAHINRAMRLFDQAGFGREVIPSITLNHVCDTNGTLLTFGELFVQLSETFEKRICEGARYYVFRVNVSGYVHDTPDTDQMEDEDDIEPARDVAQEIQTFWENRQHSFPFYMMSLYVPREYIKKNDGWYELSTNPSDSVMSYEIDANKASYVITDAQGWRAICQRMNEQLTRRRKARDARGARRRQAAPY